MSETVWVSRGHTSQVKYHTDRDCNRLQGCTVDDRQMEEVQHLEQCGWCKDGPNPNRDQRDSLYRKIQRGDVDV